MSPFVVFSLPRSRSAWLSVFLGSPEAPVGHDIGPTVDSVSEFWRTLAGLSGTCETGAAFAAGVIRDLFPEAPFLVIRRDLREVLRSLERFGLVGFDAEMLARAVDLDRISAMPGTLTFSFEALSDAEACAAVYRHCLGREMPRAWWRQLDPINIQVDMGRQLQLLIRRRPQIDALKAQVREMACG